MSRPQLVLVRLWPWLLTLVIMGPLLSRGFVLTYDMVFVPDLALRSDFLGLGSGLPRAVPSDALVAVLDNVLPGDVLQKVVLVAALGLAGTGARRLVPGGSTSAQIGATSLYLWSPFVAERLGIGHWPLLLTYAALPWIFDAARRARAGERTVPQLVLWVAFGSLSAAGGVIAALFAVACVAGRRPAAVRRTVLVAGAALAVNAPWLVAGALHGSAALSDPRGVEAFAARAEGFLPLPLTLIGLGGIWNAEVVPPSRESWAAIVQLLLVLAISAAGFRAWRSGLLLRDRLGLGLAAAVGLVVALVGSVAPDALGWVVAHVPGGGLFRDGSRFVALVAPLAASLFGTGVAAVVGRLGERAARIGVGTVLVLVPLALMPDLGLGLGGRLSPVSYPGEYAAARSAVAQRQDAGVRGDVLLVPFSSYRLPAWNEGRRTLDPTGRYLTPNFLASDVLYVDGVAIAGEDQRAARVSDLLAADLPPAELAEALGREGIGWVALDREAQAMVGDAAPSADLAGLPTVHDGPGLVVWELPRPDLEQAGRAREAAIAVAWLGALGLVVTSAALVVVRGLRRRGNVF
ncbi:hypothetical protein GON03_20340 [Nocardioides sp. MAH-18]|uniref:YfhO family protein n=1 Tax=Nocardioides agri TaxID=2682843 RepID=A0A6L6XVX2_9ACTN|nr:MULTISPECIES: hypothetical protein [unclassified Nocardioides]MBA2952374.1 hypothetical protein [Nocardioides sp. CGMCC 1.13656]MVQ51534.1 hypothetical protein [Nocardioides sp. MAH-18]